VCDLETSRIGVPYIYDISNLRVNNCVFVNIFRSKAEYKIKKYRSCGKLVMR